MRIVKESEERKNEILDIAEALFLSKGYHKTTIVDILESVGIAKGTFYYYFKSKEDVMDAIIERVVQNDVKVAHEIAQNQKLTPVQKIFCIFQGQQPQNGNQKEQLIEQFHCPVNADMHLKSITQSVRMLVPILEDVVKQGIDQGVFHTEYPKETMEILILAGQNLFDAALFKWTAEELEIKIKAFIASMELLLGAETGSLSHMHEVLAGASKERQKDGK